MKKLLLLGLFILIIFTGCENKEEDEKSEYLDMKSKLLENKTFIDSYDLPCEIVVNIDKNSSEKYSYEMVLSNTTENMYNIKAILVHNYYTEELFPTIGLFDKTDDLLKNTDDEIVLKGNIETDKDIDNLNLKLKLLLTYKDEDGKKKDIYYKTTK